MKIELDVAITHWVRMGRNPPSQMLGSNEMKLRPGNFSVVGDQGLLAVGSAALRFVVSLASLLQVQKGCCLSVLSLPVSSACVSIPDCARRRSIRPSASACVSSCGKGAVPQAKKVRRTLVKPPKHGLVPTVWKCPLCPMKFEGAATQVYAAKRRHIFTRHPDKNLAIFKSRTFTVCEASESLCRNSARGSALVVRRLYLLCRNARLTLR